MRRYGLKRIPRTHLLLFAVLFCTVIVSWYLIAPQAYGAQLGRRSLQLSSDELAAQDATYSLTFNISTPGVLGSIRIDVCSNDALVEDPCTPPVGFDASSAVLAAQSGETGFSISAASDANEIILTRAAVNAAVGPVAYQFTGITNPTSVGSYFLRIQTYATTDASGSYSDYGAVAFAITNQLAISADVPPFLLFCAANTIPSYNCTSAAGDYIDFGELSPVTTSMGSSQLLVATNAKNGYEITVTGTTLESGTDIIGAIASDDVSRPGTAQFGLNLRANTSPAIGSDPVGPGSGQPATDYDQPNFYQFVSGDVVASSPNPENYRRYTVSYIVNVPSSQPAGVYVTTMTYISTATF